MRITIDSAGRPRRRLGTGTLATATLMLVGGCILLIPLGILGVATHHPGTVIAGAFVATLIGKLVWQRANRPDKTG